MLPCMSVLSMPCQGEDHSTKAHNVPQSYLHECQADYLPAGPAAERQSLARQASAGGWVRCACDHQQNLAELAIYRELHAPLQGAQRAM